MTAAVPQDTRAPPRWPPYLATAPGPGVRTHVQDGEDTYTAGTGDSAHIHSSHLYKCGKPSSKTSSISDNSLTLSQHANKSNRNCLKRVGSPVSATPNGKTVTTYLGWIPVAKRTWRPWSLVTVLALAMMMFL
jgi:hypothetical protein